MKKFLTVLLALSVVFTYTVGTAFAAEVDKTPIANAQAAGNTAIDEAAKALLNQFTFDSDGNLTAYYVNGATVTLTTDGTNTASAAEKGYITKAVVTTAINDAAEAAKVALQNTVTTEAANATTADLVATAVANVQQAAQTQIKGLASEVIGTGNSLATLATAQEKVTKAAALAELGAYTTSQYSDDTALWSIAQNTKYEGKDGYEVSTIAGVSSTADLMSAKAFVAAVIKTQTAAVNDATGTNFEKIAKYNAATKIASDVIKGYKGASTTDYIAAVPTEEELKADTSVDAAKKSAIDKMTSALKAKAVELREGLQDVINAENKLAKPDADKVAAYQAALSGLDAQIAAAEETYTAQINAQKTVATVNSTYNTIKSKIDALAFTYSASTGTTCGELDKYLQASKDVASLKAYADEIIALVDREANPYFDESAVKDVLAAQIEKIYAGTTTLEDAKAAIRTAASVKDGLLQLRSDFVANVDGTGKAITIGTKSYPVWAGEDAYEDAQLDAYKSNVEATTKAISEATSYDAIKEAYLAGCKANESIITKAQHAKDWATGGDLKVEYDKSYANDLGAYITYTTNRLGSDYSQATGDTTLAAKVAEIVQKAYTKAEIPTQVAAAKAYLDGLKSNSELAAAKKAVEAKITALKTPVTIADKDQILDAKKAYEEYMALAGAKNNAPSNELALQNSVKSLAALELKAIKDDIAALEKAGVTINDAEKIAAIDTAIKAYNENYAAEIKTNAVGLTGPKATEGTAEYKLAALQAKLSTAQLENVAKLCAALPINPTTAEDLEKVAAAKAAFEALDIHQQAEFVDKYDLYYDKLSQVEGSLATAVTSLKITASSKAKKGSITVKWTVKGVVAAADGYQVFRSTKRNSGYGTKAYFTAKSSARTYKNTKSLKKGTRYYYKVRAYKVVDGKTYYSDWSNKAYRIAK